MSEPPNPGRPRRCLTRCRTSLPRPFQHNRVLAGRKQVPSSPLPHSLVELQGPSPRRRGTYGSETAPRLTRTHLPKPQQEARCCCRCASCTAAGGGGAAAAAALPLAFPRTAAQRPPPLPFHAAAFRFLSPLRSTRTLLGPHPLLLPTLLKSSCPALIASARRATPRKGMPVAPHGTTLSQ
eukprot:363941-Chlamydomonas_euryale.AAC.17